MSQFEITRQDGRSNQQVVIDLVKDAKPGQVFTYQQIQDALGSGTATTYSVHDAQSIVRASSSRLERLHRRTLHNVRGTGYRMAMPSEHLALAQGRESRAAKQMRRGLSILKGVRLEELTPAERALHEGHTLIAAAMYQNMTTLNRRVDALEAVIEGMKSR